MGVCALRPLFLEFTTNITTRLTDPYTNNRYKQKKHALYSAVMQNMKCMKHQVHIEPNTLEDEHALSF
jgi:hypothetical protein